MTRDIGWLRENEEVAYILDDTRYPVSGTALLCDTEAEAYRALIAWGLQPGAPKYRVVRVAIDPDHPTSIREI